MEVSRLEVPGKEPSAQKLLKNMWQRAKVLVLKLKTHEMSINMSKIDH